MAYADQEMSTRRVVAIGAVALLHAGVGYALVSGLAYNAVKQAYEDLKTFDVAPEPPPPEEEAPPPPPPDAAPPPPPKVTAPPPRVVTSIQTTNTITKPDPEPQKQVVQEIKKEEPKKVEEPKPVAPKLAEKAVLKGGSISNDDYPSSAKRNEEAGTSVASFTIGTDGRVTDCNASGAGPTLDAETCRLIIKRFKFKPAKDTTGAAIAERRTQRVTWRLED